MPAFAAMSEPEHSLTLGELLRNYRQSVPLARRFSVWVEEWLGMLLRPLPGALGFGLRWLLYKMLFRRLDGVCYIYSGARISHSYGISCGRNLMVNAGAFLYGRGGLRIGDCVMVGPNVVIVSSQHRFDDARVPMMYLGHRADPVEIGDDVWLGANAVILPGVRIATGTVVSAGAVVTRDTEPYSIVGGIPASKIGMRPLPPA
jgi:acetyltransferase-like isoleucine patch superfamily enzyme